MISSDTAHISLFNTSLLIRPRPWTTSKGWPDPGLQRAKGPFLVEISGLWLKIGLPLPFYFYSLYSVFCTPSNFCGRLSIQTNNDPHIASCIIVRNSNIHEPSSGWRMRDIEAGWRCVESHGVSFSGPLPMYINTVERYTSAKSWAHDLAHVYRMKNERYRGRVEMRWRSGRGSGRAAWECYQSPVVSNNLIIPNKKYMLHNQRNTCYTSKKYLHYDNRNTQDSNEKYTLRDIREARCVRVLSEPGREQQFDNSK